MAEGMNTKREGLIKARDAGDVILAQLKKEADEAHKNRHYDTEIELRAHYTGAYLVVAEIDKMLKLVSKARK